MSSLQPSSRPLAVSYTASTLSKFDRAEDTVTGPPLPVNSHHSVESICEPVVCDTLSLSQRLAAGSDVVKSSFGSTPAPTLVLVSATPSWIGSRLARSSLIGAAEAGVTLIKISASVKIAVRQVLLEVPMWCTQRRFRTDLEDL